MASRGGHGNLRRARDATVARRTLPKLNRVAAATAVLMQSRAGSWSRSRQDAVAGRSTSLAPQAGLVFEFDDVGAVVDADGAEVAEHVLAEEAVELYAHDLAQAVEVHDGDVLAGPDAMGEVGGGRGGDP